MNESRRCPAASKRTGEQCGQLLPLGAVVCRWHGGGAQQVRRKATERVQEHEARKDLAAMGVPVETTPIDALQAMLDEAAGNVAALRALVWELEADDLYAEIQRGEGRGYPTGEAKPHVLIVMYGDERDRLARIAKDCAALGLDERRIRLMEGEVDRLFGAVSRAMSTIPAGMRDTFRSALADQLRRPALPAR